MHPCAFFSCWLFSAERNTDTQLTPGSVGSFPCSIQPHPNLPPWFKECKITSVRTSSHGAHRGGYPLCFSGDMIPKFLAIRVFTVPWFSFSSASGGHPCMQTPKNMSPPAQSVPAIKRLIVPQLAFFAPSLFFIRLGHTLLWILSQVCLCQKAFCQVLEVSASLSSGDHPQTNGQTERVNQDLLAALHRVISRNPVSWSTHLPWVERPTWQFPLCRKVSGVPAESGVRLVQLPHAQRLEIGDWRIAGVHQPLLTSLARRMLSLRLCRTPTARGCCLIRATCHCIKLEGMIMKKTAYLLNSHLYNLVSIAAHSKAATE
ncbi:uncharacterized protein LOC144048726 isoform X2 [Vanacampus margaritifer]